MSGQNSPTSRSVELGNAVDRRGMSRYAAVYAIYNIAYAVAQMAASGFTLAAAPSSSPFRRCCASAVR
jgi:hypothetical protein